jgi:hypothetical protein
MIWITDVTDEILAQIFPGRVGGGGKIDLDSLGVQGKDHLRIQKT